VKFTAAQLQAYPQEALLTTLAKSSNALLNNDLCIGGGAVTPDFSLALLDEGVVRRASWRWVGSDAKELFAVGIFLFGWNCVGLGDLLVV
jgi:hypothetical protein